VTGLLYSDVEDALRSAVRSLLTDRCPASAVLAGLAGDEPYDRELWRGLAADIGAAGLAVPEEHGGAGAGLREAAVVLEELGRAVAPVPYLGSAVVATRVLLACAATDLVGPLAAGERIAALAVPFATAPAGPVPQVSVAAGTLSGTIRNVADALGADTLLVPGGDALYAVDATDAGLTRSPVVSLDETRRLCDITLDRVEGRPVAAGVAARTAVSAGLSAGAALLASEQLGVAEWCLDTTVDHARTRYQFGRPIGSFQAVKHRLADLWVEISQARAVARYAAACVATDDADAAVAVAVAQAHCSAVAVRAAEDCVQLHGGIGFTWEHPAHLYLKRARSSAIAFGTADAHRAHLAVLVDLPAPG
jgi:alkylation response protein AidB-like acyl-CoA dehydrogenase